MRRGRQHLHAISFVDLTDPAAVSGALEGLRRMAAWANVGAAAPRAAPFAFPGTTPNPQAARVEVDGRLPDGTAVREHAAFFVRGLRVYQASVIGAAPAAEAVETFIGGLKLAVMKDPAADPVQLAAARAAIGLAFLCFAFAYFFSALLRGVTATLAPVFSAELALGAGDLGLLAGAFFFGFAVSQLRSAARSTATARAACCSRSCSPRCSAAWRSRWRAASSA